MEAALFFFFFFFFGVFFFFCLFFFFFFFFARNFSIVAFLFAKSMESMRNVFATTPKVFIIGFPVSEWEVPSAAALCDAIAA